MTKFVLEVSGGAYDDYFSDHFPITYPDKDTLEFDIDESKDEYDNYHMFDMTFDWFNIQTIYEWFEKEDLNKNATKTFLVALQVGGIQGDPTIRHINNEYIEAKTQEEAVEIYNKRHNCDFFYGVCLKRIN